MYKVLSMYFAQKGSHVLPSCIDRGRSRPLNLLEDRLRGCYSMKNRVAPRTNLENNKIQKSFKEAAECFVPDSYLMGISISCWTVQTSVILITLYFKA